MDNPFPGGNGLRLATNEPKEIIDGIAGQALGSIYRWQKEPAYDDSFNFSVQRELPARTVVEVSYAGNRGHNLNTRTVRVVNYLPAQYLSLGTQLRRAIPNPFVGSNLPITSDTPSNALQRAATIEYQNLLTTYPHAVTINMNHFNAANSWYNALYLRMEKRMSHGLSFQGAYTMSKLVTDIEGQPQDGATVRDVRALSGEDFTHKFVMSWLYELPVGKGRSFLREPATVSGKILDAMAGGWRLGGIYQHLSGGPLRVTQSSATMGTGLNQRPSIVGSYTKVKDVYQAVGLPGQTAALYVNGGAFDVTPAYTIGTAPYYLPDLRAPSRQQWDLSLMKVFTLTEKVRLQLRIEAENAFNQVSFAGPTMNIQSAAFGTIENTQSGPRQLQIGARIDW